MTRFLRRISIFLLLICSLLNSGELVAKSPFFTFSLSGYVVTRYQTSLYRYQLNSGLCEKTDVQIPSGSLFLINRWSNIKGVDYYEVVSAFSPEKTGFLPFASVFPLNDRLVLEELQRTVDIQKAPLSDNFESLILQESSSESRRILQMIQSAWVENSKLPPTERLAEPFFARAQAWNKYNRFSDAMLDYYKALEATFNNPQLDPIYFRKYYSEIEQTLEKSQKFSSNNVTSKTYTSASNLYMLGYRHFWETRYRQALDCFDQAISIHGGDPVYWYYRGLTWKRLGNEDQALYNILFGVRLERLLYGDRSYKVSQSLYRFQGTERQWLENLRAGGSIK